MGEPAFWWGATASSVSAEGVAPAADWSRWERDGRAPRSHDGAGFSVDFRDDLAQLARLGLNSIRLTVEWARVEPAPGRPDSDALDRYLDVVDAAAAAGLAPWLTLHHTSLPGWYLDDEGGHADSTARRRWWARHVDRMAEAFDGRAAGWCPVEDPIGWAVRGYGLGTRPPGRTGAEQAAAAAEGAMLALHEACRLLRSGQQPVMAVFGAPTVHPAPADSREAQAAVRAARRWDDLIWGTWTRALQKGVLQVPGRAPVPAPCFETGPEVFGLSHDHPVGVTGSGRLTSWPASARRSAAGFAPEPAELAEAVHRAIGAVSDGRSVVVAAHGVPTSDDDWRDALLGEALAEVADARGAGLRGYFHDSAVDGYEWTLGFNAPRGLFTRGRAVKPSARRLSAAAGVDAKAGLNAEESTRDQASSAPQA